MMAGRPRSLPPHACYVLASFRRNPPPVSFLLSLCGAESAETAAAALRCAPRGHGTMHHAPQRRPDSHDLFSTPPIPPRSPFHPAFAHSSSPIYFPTTLCTLPRTRLFSPSDLPLFTPAPSPLSLSAPNNRHLPSLSRFRFPRSMPVRVNTHTYRPLVPRPERERERGVCTPHPARPPCCPLATTFPGARGA